jgi:hypothetical protein
MVTVVCGFETQKRTATSASGQPRSSTASSICLTWATRAGSPPQLLQTGRPEAFAPRNRCALSLTHLDLHIQAAHFLATPSCEPLRQAAASARSKAWRGFARPGQAVQDGLR